MVSQLYIEILALFGWRPKEEVDYEVLLQSVLTTTVMLSMSFALVLYLVPRQIILVRKLGWGGSKLA